MSAGNICIDGYGKVESVDEMTGFSIKQSTGRRRQKE
jgi:hypothetical protein